MWRYKKWERRNSEFAQYESQCELESQRHQLRQASQWADQAHREIMRLCGELERKNRFHSRKLHKKPPRNRRIMKTLLSGRTQIVPIQIGRILYAAGAGSKHSESSQGSNQRITRIGEFHDPDSGNSSGISHVPNQPLITSSSSRKPSRDSGFLRDTRNDMGIRGNDFEDLPAREGHPSEFFENSINLALSSRMTRKERTGNFYGERK